MAFQMVRKYEDAIDRDYCDVMMHVFETLEDAYYAICEERMSIIDEEPDFGQEDESKNGADLILECDNIEGKLSSKSTFSVFQIDPRIHVTKYEDEAETGFFLGIPVEELSKYEDCKIDLDWEQVKELGFLDMDKDEY